MADLRIDYKETISVGNQILSKAEQFKTLLGNINSVNSQLKTYWEGSDASKYSGAVETQAKYMEDLASAIDSMGTFLTNVGNAYQKAMEDNANLIK